ncbi:MAG: Phage SPO1 DNA polymerase-related protein [Candidatus Moranbacteria bacterium GW2011_GWE2_35_2-]|nr:MAG: Phage SPO1 DNA polymerase-related protein [Candidatus Moranbacteria bacterium GW2011_GWE2_35_2-]KKQ22391.1 MAG: Phage SPO1 DNA polymerase-related protein [Candidatus Moranbacteria bacterium GW2011_GWF2_37_11]KKQ29459.1 MAG: Phage SPO1 DNA polymerase-related protein [Candidatus Moranbacteria bacterium GW2011_GWD1_37_17]KKQ30673.1 MAG: Phage SPO1 DNA polymerase-related protein [Candidatus Moranbacteria bacterium GW2011_GWE1_37_24]HBO17084.1 uracil-DNA glycosylase [Candidatus Moranbacteria
MPSKQEQLGKLNEKMSKCSKCSLRKNCSRVVFGEGNPNAKIMFVGEAPGKKEDETGRPFVGAAGKFLNEMLAVIKLKREDVYIANVCKCRPPKNRDPLPEEIKLCWPWLEQQVKIINPKIIITLGRHSMERFISEEKISEAHGKLFVRKIKGLGERNFFTLYHPAAALYNGNIRQTLIQDFKKIPEVLEKIKKEK